MCIIKASIHRAQKQYVCWSCDHIIRKADRYMRLFGMAELGDDPYEVMAHLLCLMAIRRSPRNKPIFEALDKNGPPYATDGKGNIIHIEYYP